MSTLQDKIESAMLEYNRQVIKCGGLPCYGVKELAENIAKEIGTCGECLHCSTTHLTKPFCLYDEHYVDEDGYCREFIREKK